MTSSPHSGVSSFKDGVSNCLRIGAAMFDITYPAAEAGMFGYAKVGQLTSNIHMRLRAHAFAFQDLESKGMGVLDYNIPVIASLYNPYSACHYPKTLLKLDQ
ncbi:hypothetical protein CCR75_001308 [Bremia lactucae]|uniref:Neutral/alkaline non-lysosomal ceramidase N-terminal domain-containing protein n=1 Tax=Bremia lactucae TaxID=4779 RepID=A0A976FFR0_BRELC|nr:hypothetical protein CCR75_001308 [Bremia lactucae]